MVFSNGLRSESSLNIEGAPSVKLPRRAPAWPPIICITSGAQDLDLTLQVSEILGELGADALLAPEPQADQSPEDFNSKLKQVIQGSQGVIIVYGRINPAWVQSQYVNARKILAQHRHGIWGALLDGPPLNEPPHGVISPSLMRLDCRAGLEREQVARFVDAVRVTSDV